MSYEIVSGEVEYTTPRPFETNSARVKLSFTIAPGADPNQATLLVGNMARQRAENMVDGRMTATEVLAEEGAPVPPTRTRAKPAIVAPAALPGQNATPPQPTVAQTVEPGPTSVIAPTSVVQPVGLIPSPASVDPRLSDQALKEAQSVKMNAIKLAGQDTTSMANAIKALRAKFTGDPALSITVVTDMTLRAQFLNELAAL